MPYPPQSSSPPQSSDTPPSSSLPPSDSSSSPTSNKSETPLFDPTIMREGFSTMLAAREIARQRILLTGWEIEEAKRLSSFLGHIQAEHEGQPSRADELLQDIKSFFTYSCRADVESRQDYLQAILEDESKTFQIITAQAKEVSNLLGRDVTQSFLRFTGDSSSQPSGTVGEPSKGGEYILDVDSNESDD